MQDPYAADFAKVALEGIPRVRGPGVDGEVLQDGEREGPHARRWEDGRCAKGGGGLFLAFEAVAAVD